MAVTEAKIFKDSIPASIAPWMEVADGVKAVSFYKAAFGAVEVYRFEEGNGLVVRMAVEGAEFWISSEASGVSNQAAIKASIRMILTVTNPDVLFAKALLAGAKEVFPVSEDHGWRVGRLEDPFGIHWEIGRPITSK